MELLETLSPLAALSGGPIAVFMGVVARISGLVFFLPGLGERMISVRARLAATLSIALILTPIVAAHGPAPEMTPTALAALIAAESVTGALFGFSIRIAVYAIQVAGAIAAQGMSLSQLFTGIDDAQEPPVAIFLMFAAIAVAVSAGLHFEAVAALSFSYDLIPFGAFPGADDTGEWAARRAAFTFTAALSLAMPFVLLGFIYNLAIGAMNRAMPQLMVAFVGAPAISLAGMALLALGAPTILGAWKDLLAGVMAGLEGIAA